MTSVSHEKQEADIVFVASCNVDLVSYVDRIPVIGETIFGNEFKMGFGGKGANKCIAASRLRSKCAIICKLGKDIFGNDYLQNLKDNNIGTNCVFFTDKAATGVAPIIVDKSGHNSIIVVLGANLHLTNDDVNKCDSLVRNAKILVTNLEIPLETALYSLKFGKENNLLTVLNFAPATTNVSDTFFEHTDILILNEVEAEQLSGVVVENVECAFKASNLILQSKGINEGVAITLGDNGVVWTSKRDSSVQFHVESKKVTVVDTAGAGDAFVGSFSHYLSKLGLQNIRDVIELANEYASFTVQRKGTQTSYPYLTDLDSKFQI